MSRDTSLSRASGEDGVIDVFTSRGIPVIGLTEYKNLQPRMKGRGRYRYLSESGTKGKIVVVRNYPYTKCHGHHGNMDLTVLFDDKPIGLLEVKNQQYRGSAAERWYCAIAHPVHLNEKQFFVLVCSGAWVRNDPEIIGIVKDLQNVDANVWRQGTHYRAPGVRKDVEVFNREDVDDEVRFQLFIDAKLANYQI